VRSDPVRVASLAAAVIAAAALGLLAPASGLGHTGLESSSVRHGSTVRTLPKVITLRFAARPLRVERVTLRRAGRNQVRAVRQRGTRVRVATKPGRTGVYRLRWRIIAADGHRQAGLVVFRVGRTTRPKARAAQSAATPGAALSPIGW
jgi:methionine-rich copper-binding protein CopC